VAAILTLRVDAQNPDPAMLETAWAAIQRGDLLIYPTDTLYALGGAAWDGTVARKVREAKGRDEGKPLPVIARDVAQAVGLCKEWPSFAERLAQAFWPGPLTLVLPSASGVPFELSGRTVAVRVPGPPLARELCRFGPLISTSANRSGRPAPSTCAQALVEVGQAVALALDGGEGQKAPSTVVDLTSDPPRALRPGAVPWDEVERVLRGGGS
jgi:L-threonylcarbamoyladenylate synthase